MKKISVFILTMAFSFVLVACGNAEKDNGKAVDEPVTDETNKGETNGATVPNDTIATDETQGSESANTEKNMNAANQEDMQKKMDDLEYVDFELSVDYANHHKEYEAELEKNSDNSIKAEIEDSLNKVKKKGTEAFDELYPMVKQLTITQQTSKADAIQEVMSTFDLPNDYTEFEMEIRFNDGTKIEFEDRK
ncbi:YusW family protein [Sporosarcina sp. JAI121]|uniref:YusW family protein n=1 Tax=Sporosarcina sp. JAI121 TaxID=2723064 RepID=UPI0015CD9FC8|nr:YusW family protein [Sporosarcina sp. JAI121]NYF25321.1 tRNA U54 and U55 pseudouridine synthase Pus10 [Sporosarcina sp. JAI121]